VRNAVGYNRNAIGFRQQRETSFESSYERRADERVVFDSSDNNKVVYISATSVSSISGMEIFLEKLKELCCESKNNDDYRLYFLRSKIPLNLLLF
jgi:hypothetical protein